MCTFSQQASLSTVQAEEHQQAALQGSSAGAPAAEDWAAQSPREHFEVAASGVYPAGSPPCPLPEAVLQLFPHQFTSVTSAKRACRRGEIWLDGTKLKTKSQKYVTSPNFPPSLSSHQLSCKMPCTLLSCPRAGHLLARMPTSQVYGWQIARSWSSSA